MSEENPIIEEIRRTRQQMLAKHDGDLNSLVSELQGLSVERVRAVRPVIVPPERPGPHESAPAKNVG